jgi:hypothetical protein
MAVARALQARPVEHDVALGDVLQHFKGARKTRRNDARVAGAELPGLAGGVDDAQTAADDLEEFVATGMEGDAPDPGSQAQSPMERAPSSAQ